MEETKLIFLDLELNTIQGRDRDKNPIISVGAVVGGIQSGIIYSKFHEYIKVDEQITEYITQLTGITQKDVDGGISLIEAVRRLHDLQKTYDAHPMIATWGGDDVSSLKDQHLAYGGQQWEFRRRELDVKTIMQNYCLLKEMNPSGGLKRSLGKLGLCFRDGKPHRADADAINTFYIYLELAKRMNLR
jgi:inhibitor of KinA sporulation pathway (predicted exonuclease)